MRVSGHELSDLRVLAETTATVAAAYDAGVFRALAGGAETRDGKSLRELVADWSGWTVRTYPAHDQSRRTE